MNVEFCEDKSGTLKKMRYFRKKNSIGWEPRPPGPSPGSATEAGSFKVGISYMCFVFPCKPKAKLKPRGKKLNLFSLHSVIIYSILFFC